MPATALNRSDYRHSDAKAACRQFNVDGLRGSLHLAPPLTLDPSTRDPYSAPPGPLRYDWLEFAGEGAPMADTLAPLLSGRGQYIGVDKEQTVVYRLTPRPFCHYRAGLLENLLYDEPELISRVGVLNIDSTWGWFGKRPEIVPEVHTYTRFICRQIERARLREFLLIVNADTRNRDRRTEIEPTIEAAFAPILEAFPSAELDLDPAGPNVRYYRGRGGKADMANVRLKIGYR